MGKIRNIIRNILRESMMRELEINNDMVDEERITNPESKEFVKNRENFIGSHIWGEDLGDYGKMYVAYSYGEQYPAYLFYKGKWYHNTDNYVNPDGTLNTFNKAHMEDMKPTNDTHGVSGMHMKNAIRKFMKKHGIEDVDHKSVQPGQKNE